MRGNALKMSLKVSINNKCIYTDMRISAQSFQGANIQQPEYLKTRLLVVVCAQGLKVYYVVFKYRLPNDRRKNAMSSIDRSLKVCV